MGMVSRASWGARKPRRRYTVTWAQRTEFFVHHTAGPPGQSMKTIQDFHMDGRGWSDIGYGHLVDDDGVIYQGRGWLVVGAHCPGHNRSGESVAYIGQNAPTAAAVRSIRWLYDEACRRAGKRLRLLGHGQRFATSCPGPRLQAWLAAGMPIEEQEQEQEQELIRLVWHDGVPVWPGRVLELTRPMMHGEDIEAVQEKLRTRGWTITVDGLYGEKTRGSIRLYQARTGLPVTGRVDEPTWDMVWSWRPPATP